MAAISQISRRGSQGRAYHENKLAEGMGRKAALRALKRKISDALYARMLDDARRSQDPGGHSGNDAASSAAGSHPETPALRTSHSRATANPRTATSDQRLLTSPPAPDRRRTSRSTAGVQVEPHPDPRRRGRGQDRPNGQMNRSSPRTDRVAEPSVKIAGPAQPMSAPSPLRAPRVLDEDRRGSNWRCRQRAAGVGSDLRNTSGRRALVDEIGLDSTPAACRCAGGGSHVLIVVVVRAADTDHLLLRRERLSSATDRGPCRCAGVTKRLVGCRALEPCH
jgi:hypothetical protein